MSEEVYLRNQRELFYDKHVALELEGVGQDTPDEGVGDALGGDLGGDLGASAGEFAGGGEDAAIAGDEAPAPEATPGEDTALLAAPGAEAAAEPPAGKRDDDKKDNIKYIDTKTGETTTTKSKDWYMPKKVDKRSAGARTRHIKSLGSHEMARAPKRQLSPGAKEILGLTGLGKGIFENQNTNYDEEERKLFETKESVRELFEGLELLDE